MSEPFTVETGVQQGCIIAPTLFSVFVTAILHLIGKDLPQVNSDLLQNRW